METNMEVKVDKRTKEYKEMVGNPEAAEAILTPPGEPIGKIPPPPKPKPDLLHCPRCGVELLEDERNGKSVAHCRKCIWENA